MSSENLESKIRKIGDPLKMLRNSATKRFQFDYPDQYTNWQTEQTGWAKTATLFDQSHHMTDVYFEGPDVDRLMEKTSTNSFRTWGPNKAKHIVTCTEEGKMVGTAILFGLEKNLVNVVGPAACANWISYQAEIGGYDVKITRDERTADQPAGGRRQIYRFEIEGPMVPQILEKANGGPIEQVKFFGMTEFKIAGRTVRALSHTMAGVPGSESMGFEIWGPVEDSRAVWNGLLEAGQEFGILPGGALAYYTGAIESGYAAQPTPAIYSAPELKAYREWLPANGYEGKLSIGGSYKADSVEDYYVSPYDFGYGHLVKFDHDFIGREALEKNASQPHRKKVWLRWNDEDVGRVNNSALFDGANRAKYLETPLQREARVLLDSVHAKDGRFIGVSTLRGYTVNIGSWVSTTFVDEADAVDGSEVTLLWGEEKGGSGKLTVEPHVQTEIRGTIHTSPVPYK